MALRPEIALGVKPPDIMNPAQMLSLQNISQQNQLGQMQIEDVLRQRQDDERLRGLFSDPSLIDPKTGTVSLEGVGKAYSISPKVGASLAKDRQASLKSVAEMAKLDTETKVQRSKLYRDFAAQVTDQAGWDALIAQGRADGAAFVDSLPARFSPEAQRSLVMDADKFIQQNTPKYEPTDIGGEVKMIDRNPVTNPAIKGTNLAKTMTPGEVATDKRAAATLAETQRHHKVIEGQDSFGPATEVTGPDGKPKLVMQNKKTGQMVDANTKEPIAGVGPKIGEQAQKQQAGVATVKDAISEYREALKNWSATDIASPNARARMGTIYNNMLLQAKEAYNLGVLNGPDYMILQTVVTDPASLKGGLTSKKALDDQAKKLDEIMTRVGEKVTQTQSGIPSAQPPQASNDLEKKVKAAGHKYEPDRYDYRVGPNGNVQRKLKSG